MDIELLIEKYLGKFQIASSNKAREVFVNPTTLDIKNMKEEFNMNEVRFVIYKPTKEVFVWHILGGLHFHMFNELVKRGMIKSSASLSVFEYGHPDIICGEAEVFRSKMRVIYPEDYADRSDEIFADYSKYFSK